MALSAKALQQKRARKQKARVKAKMVKKNQMPAMITSEHEQDTREQACCDHEHDHGHDHEHHP